MKKKIAVVLVNRANYARMKPVMQALQHEPDVDMQTLCAGSMLLDRYGCARNVVEADGFPVESEVYLQLEGSVPITMVKSIGLAVIEFASEFSRMKPDFVLMIGDRYEAMAAAIAAAYQNICLIHLQGGEISGSIDESTRHAITKLAHYHFPATKRAAEYIVAMGEDPDTVFPLGCPTSDVVLAASNDLPQDVLGRLGVGTSIDFSKPYLLVLFHPVTTDIGHQEEQMEAVLETVRRLNIQTVLLWPNIDAGSDLVSQAIRRFREHHHEFPLHAYKNLPPDIYIPLLNHAACCIGNSSSFVRETSFFGTPVVLVGSRQDGREWSPSVIRVEPLQPEIESATRNQLAHGRYGVSDLYGSPGVAARIASQVAKLTPYAQKQLHYVKRPSA
ncbi:UDP-N-acetylglucosamine 2-epimerase [Prosthecobacter sp.]|uniref:UDP-N-acetylglucosamine 2-epimerase n=1 Tax=Prosthecobacter sp. TaxID=1965333 RepID=UPI00378356FF